LPTFGVRFISHLKTMRLHDNQIGGSIHELAGNLTELTALALHNNEIGGMLPESMTNMQKLEEVTMHNNQFSGPIPEVSGSSLMFNCEYP
jgi:Leucine-rich repeat (LRR) protein